MKTNRNIWRIVTLALALVMLFSVVACSNEEEEPVITTAADGTTAAPSTTKKPATTEKPTTEKPTTQTTATTEPTTEPTTELPAYSVVVPSNFDANNDGVNDSYLFANKIPAVFLAEGVIKVSAADHAETDKGVGKAERISGSGIYHYYINTSNTEIPDDEKTLTYTFTVTEAGTYDVMLDLGMKDTAEQRGAVFYLDGGDGIAMDYTVTAEFAAAVRDETHGTYVTGLSLELTAGEHTLVVKYNPFCNKTIHFRNFYFVKSTKTAIDMTSNFDNDGDGNFDVFTFTNYMPMEYGDANAIIVHAGDYDKENDKGVGSAERISGSGIRHYYINRDNKDIADDDKTMTYKFTVAEAGKYKVCFGLGMKDTAEQRGATIIFDGEQTFSVDYTVTAEFATAVRDETHGSYMTGMIVELAAGEHTMVIKYQPMCNKTMHFRNFYFIKMVEAAA